MSELLFTPKLKPLAHQAAFLSDHNDDVGYGLFHEQGTGKTASLIWNAAQLFMQGKIDSIFVLAPSGVHYNWVVEELPKHWPDEMPPYRAFFWNTKKADQVGFNKSWQQFLKLQETASGALIPWLCMSYDGILTESGKAASWEFMRGRRVLYIADESQRIKGHQLAGKNKKERTTVVTKSGLYASYRRLASGTPMDKPFDIYAQVRFLDPDFWVRELGLGSFASFKSYFGEFVQINVPGGHSFPKLKNYRRLDELERVLKKISSRVLKKDVLDLPPKTYKRHFHELSVAQRRAYDELKSEAMTILDSGELVDAKMALILRLRFSQISSGFAQPGAGAAPVLFNDNPREQLCRTLLEDLTGPVIAWARFVPDVAAVLRAGRAAGRVCVEYDGGDPGASLELWHAGKADLIVANLSSGLVEGNTLNEAADTIYFSRSRKLIQRQQSEDRNHRIGQLLPVTYHDLLATGTLDAVELDDLRTKRQHVGAVLGDDEAETGQWLVENATDEVADLRRHLEEMSGND